MPGLRWRYCVIGTFNLHTILWILIYEFYDSLRYSKDTTPSNRMFGISLYQQKNIELRPEGRRPFDPKHLFVKNDLSYPNTPYLSQIPCSWGGVYFPEHWREFHSYLINRLSESTHTIEEIIVPSIRSNKWSKSWKKYFIELVYLRGYVMLYPNYDNFTSFSTNHLEVGAHVRGDLSKRTFAKKKAQFNLPLMPLPAPLTGGTISIPGILDLPEGSLPTFSALPVVDLWGHITTSDEIILRGYDRHHEMMDCEDLNTTASDYNATNLLCGKRRSVSDKELP